LPTEFAQIPWAILQTSSANLILWQLSSKLLDECFLINLYWGNNGAFFGQQWGNILVAPLTGHFDRELTSCR
jgi:hypothetical protein